MIPSSLKELERIRDECKSMVTTRAGLSAGAAIVPVPGADIGADVMLLLEMIPMINRKFGLAPEQIDHLDPQIKKLILVAATSIGSEMIGKLLTKEIILQVLKRLGIRVASCRIPDDHMVACETDAGVSDTTLSSPASAYCS